MKEIPIQKIQKDLLGWYRKNHRPLPWRQTKDPYPIWISEIMLQQTTVAAVRPYYERFLTAFPSLESLANAPEESVIENWSGLGYYSRARNIHKTAKLISKSALSWPKSWKGLINLPGLGPYTARAISSICFGEKTGVLDGNVIRFLSRYHNLKTKWWTTKARNELQLIADTWANHKTPDLINQSMIEMGATVCLKENPACLICPLNPSCQARAVRSTHLVPLKKPKRDREIWVWEPILTKSNKKFGLKSNDYAPFLKGHLIWPGKVRQVKSAPTKFDFKHAVTHHDIYVQVRKTKNKDKGLKWIPEEDLKKHSPTSLVSKVLQFP